MSQVGIGKASVSEPLMMCRDQEDGIETEASQWPWREPVYWPGGTRHEGGGRRRGPAGACSRAGRAAISVGGRHRGQVASEIVSHRHQPWDMSVSRNDRGGIMAKSNRRRKLDGPSARPGLRRSARAVYRRQAADETIRDALERHDRLVNPGTPATDLRSAPGTHQTGTGQVGGRGGTRWMGSSRKRLATPAMGSSARGPLGLNRLFAYSYESIASGRECPSMCGIAGWTRWSDAMDIIWTGGHYRPGRTAGRP